jgi:hypothetical protein
VPDYIYTLDNGGTVFITEADTDVFGVAKQLITLGVQGPPGIQGPPGPAGPPNTTPLSTVAGNALTLGADGGLFVPPPAWASTNW